MRKLALLGILFLLSSIVYSQDFDVKKFTIDIDVSEEGYFDVTEKYDIYFDHEKHGIYRDIIKKYKFQASDTGKVEDREIIISNIEVVGHKFSLPSKLTQKYSDEIQIKIGDPDVYVSGDQQYIIKYRVENAFIFENDIVQFYWNLKPNDWRTTFQEVEFNIHTPKGYELSIENSFLYAGYKTTEPSMEFDYSYDNYTFSGRSIEKFSSSRGESITALIKLPREAIKEIDYSKPWWEEYSWLAIIGILFAGIRGRWRAIVDPREVVATTSYYPPEGMDPALAGFVIDDVADNRDLVSLIPHWGAKGLVQVKDIPKQGIFGKADVELTKIGELPVDSTSYEKTIFNGLFKDGDTIKTSDLKEKFYTTMNAAKIELKSAADTYYDTKTNNKAANTGCLFIFLSLVVGVIFLYVFNILAAIVSVIALFVASSKFFKRKKTDRGNDAFSELLGFSQFIKIAEVNRIKMLIEDDPDYFEKTMSYAVAFNMLEKWAGKFADLGIEPPDWYSSTAGPMTMAGFSNSFGNNMNNIRNNFVSAPSSGGSGFSGGGGGSSGGGFGGGGGGSW